MAFLEAYRTLHMDGYLNIIESTSRFSDRDKFTKDLESLGFIVVQVKDIWKFTHIRVIKIEREPEKGVILTV